MSTNAIKSDKKELNQSPRLIALLIVLGLLGIWGGALFAYRENHFSLAYLLEFASLGSVAFVFLIIVIRTKNKSIFVKKKLSILTLIATLGLGSISMLVFPPGSVPDETYHYYNSYHYANVILGIHDDSSSSLSMRSCDANFVHDKFSSYYKSDSGLGLGVDAKGMDYFRKHIFQQEDTHTITTLHSDNQVAFTNGGGVLQSRIATAAGILIGRALSLNSLLTFYLGRIFNLILFSFLVFLAIRIIPYGSKIIAAISLLPMSINLAASYSYDSAIMGLAFLLIALLLRAVSMQGPIRAREVISILLVSFLLAPLKLVYAPLVIIGLFIPRKRFASIYCESLFKASLILICLISILIWQIPNLGGFLGAGDNAAAAATQTGLAESEPSSPTILFLFMHPLRTLMVFIKTIYETGGWLVDTTIGSSLGWFQPSIVAPWFITPAYIVLLFVASQRFSVNSKIISLNRKVLFGIVFLICAALLFAVFYLTTIADTHNSTLLIIGMQGRYFIPILPLLLLLLRVNRFHYKYNWSYYLPLVFFIFNYLYFLDVYVMAAAV